MFRMSVSFLISVIDVIAVGVAVVIVVVVLFSSISHILFS